MGEVLADQHKWIRAVGPLAILLLGALALARAWAYGPDVQVDFGRELYLPWRVSQGDRLYAELAHFSGPLSVAWHALLFSLFGTSLVVVKVSNAIVTAFIASLVYGLALRFSDRWGAAAASVFFVAVVAFGQFQPIGNYDYLTPYAHELTHGIALSLLGLWLFVRGGPYVPLACGVIVGLVSLTKIEVFTAFAAALGLGFVLRTVCSDVERSARELGGLACGFLGTLVLGWFFLVLHADVASASAGLLDPWRNVVTSDVASQAFYRWVMGTLDLPASLMAIGTGALVYVAAGLLFAVVSIANGRWDDRRIQVAEFALAAALIASISLPPAWAMNAIRPLPLVMAGLLLTSALRFSKTRQSQDVARLTVIAFAFFLPFKMLLNAQFGHYGFALYMPAVAVGIALLTGSMPGWLEARGGSSRSARLWACVLLWIVAAALHARTDAQFARRTEVVGHGGDVLLADSRAAAVDQALEFLEGLEGEASVAILPEGIMLNYLARRVTPTPYVNFMPPEFSMYGSDVIVEAFRASPPDVVLFVHKNAGLYGTPFFGRDYGRALYGWVLANYDAVETFGDTPFDPDTRFGITVLERNPGSGR